MDFNAITIDILKTLASIAGNYGVAIILLTIIVRLLLWPLNVSQQRSMRKMQDLQPKLKAIQDRYKSNPQMMQTKMMEFYKEHNFNPMGGCMPLLIQMPVFILLYSALMSPAFIQVAGNSHFLFVNRLDTTLRASAEISNDGTFGVSKTDIFALGKAATVYLPGGEIIENVKIDKPAKSLEVKGGITPGEPIDFVVTIDALDLKFTQSQNLEKAEIAVTDTNTREIEKLTFERKGDVLTASVPTKEATRTFHYDVLILIALFGLTMWLSQKIMMKSASSAGQDPTQAAMQKSMSTFMPIMIIGTFIIIPIPAGVFLYLVTSNVLQIVQTVVVNKQIDAENAKKKAAVSDSDLKNAKKIESKDE